MPSGQNGWSDILGESADVPREVDRTDPTLEQPDFESDATVDHRPPSSATHSDPVLRAMAELDGPASIPPDAFEIAPTLRTPSNPPDSQPGNRLPLPKASATPAPAFDSADTVDGMEKFEPNTLLKHLTGDSSEDVPAGPSLWGTYRAVIIAGLAGAALFSGAIAYTTSRAPEPVILPPEMLPAPAKLPSVAPKPEPAALQAAKEAPPSPKASTPMLTVVSQPTGALVEVNGVVYGKTPLIRPAPSDRQMMEVVVKRDGFKRFVQQVSPTEAGHYSVSAQLVPVR